MIMTMVQAISQALAGEMARDDRIVVLGEDVGRDGGVFRATEGLFDRFGPDRVMDTPLAESGAIGAAIGMAALSLRPAKDRAAFGATYGWATAVDGLFDGNLQADGETLTLLRPGTNGSQSVVVTRLRYEAGLPWPVGAGDTAAALSVPAVAVALAAM